MKQGFQLVRSDVSNVSRMLGLKESIRQLSPSHPELAHPELGYLSFRIVTQFSVEQAHLYIMALPTWAIADLNTDLNTGEQIQQLERMLAQFFSQESIQERRLERKISVIDNFELASQRYCVVQVTLVDQGDYFQVPLQDLLSPREQAVICLIAVGLSNKQIASRLDISIWTVSAHLRRIFTKLKVDTRAAVVYQCSKLIPGWEKIYGLTDTI